MNWKKDYAEKINQEIEAINDSSQISEEKKTLKMMMLKDCVYLLGISLNKEKYSYITGFRKFVKDMNIKLDI